MTWYLRERSSKLAIFPITLTRGTFHDRLFWGIKTFQHLTMLDKDDRLTIGKCADIPLWDSLNCFHIQVMILSVKKNQPETKGAMIHI